MPPPPAQAGKFKPRKPVKKISRPGETSTADAPTSSSTPTVAFAPSTDNNASRSERESEGRDGRGRGGRGGRGRGRGPIPSGRVFFTGGEKPSASAKRKAATEKAAGLIRAKSKDQEATEEVVGQLETAIGSSKGAGLGGPNSMDYTEEYQQSNFGDQAEKGSFAMEGFMYDSDSSREEERAKGKSKQYSTIEPLELPFPSEPLPLGIGSSVRPVAYESSTGNPSPDAVPSEQGVAIVNQDAAEPSVCPFVDPKDKEKLSWEQNSWFLVQLPTRLPPLQPKTTDGPMPVYSAEDPIDDINVEDPNQLAAISDLVTPPITAKSHDNVLTGVAPGRIGRILVYKSGKTVLKLEGPDGSSSILMNVNEGLSCSFLQQAVIIDPEEAKYVTLGNVTKSIVITPDLESALVAE